VKDFTKQNLCIKLHIRIQNQQRERWVKLQIANKIAHQTFLQQQQTTYHDKEEDTNKYIEHNADVPTDRRQKSAPRI
jgi:hypothetical protein